MKEKICLGCKRRVVLNEVKCLECDHMWHRSCAKRVRCLQKSNGYNLICSAHMEEPKKIGQKRKSTKEVDNGDEFRSEINDCTENMEESEYGEITPEYITRVIHTEDEVVEDNKPKKIKQETTNSENSQKVKNVEPEPREIQYLKDIIDCKNELIRELRDKINILKTHLARYEKSVVIEID